jgi:DNA topoisomerase-3
MTPRMTRVVVAEKPSVARDLAKVLGANARGDGYLHGNSWVVTWAIGHLVALPQPHEIEATWKSWRWDALPMLPRRWPLSVLDGTKDQFAVVKGAINAPDVEDVVCATDAGREGELIFRFIYEAARCKKPVKRLWISSLTAEAIKQGFARLEDGAAREPLAAAARGRAQTDWLVGMNLSRAYSIGQDEVFSVGRVQTPTLAMLVEREKAIQAFVPEDYLEVTATFAAPGGQYTGTWFSPTPPNTPLPPRKRLPPDGAAAQALVDRVTACGQGVVESSQGDTKRWAPPQLYDLTELQRHANRLYGFSAQRTLDVAQALYEHHKLLSYPRTDSRHLPQDVARTLSAVTNVVAPRYPGRIAPGTGERPLSRRHVDDAEVSDHHAIIPTTISSEGLRLSADEERIYDLVCRRLLQAWHGDHVFDVTTVITRVDTVEGAERFHSSGTAIQQAGWKVLDIQKEGRGPKHKTAEDDDDEEDSALPAGLKAGLPVDVTGARSHKKQTRPPKRLTDASLLSAMEGAGKLLEDKELSRAMKERGLGTPATRAAILENLIKRGYVERQGKLLAATAKGIALVDRVHPEVKSPAMTGDWEAQLRQVERGALRSEAFLERIEQYVTDVIGRVRKEPVVPQPSTSSPPAASGSGGFVTPLRRADLGSRQMTDLLSRVFGHPAFRPHQQAVCETVASGQDTLLVMPTGAGKSLCYQLPGLVRGGCTLVISPLIALMEDQVAHMQELGLAAERIHSGRPRQESRAACQAYLQGTLDYLFIAPERLAVPGFPEMLAKRKPALVAVDEAHCISQWGHDFRPEYRMLSQRLPLLMPVPIMALTATATPRVQQDIVDQLGIPKARRFIHGFRRDNLGLELVEIPKPSRHAVARALLQDPQHRPAILYAPSRADAEELAGVLSSDFSCDAYHAGLTPQKRDAVQTAFLDGKMDAVVATIAFGMGVDKANIRTVVHLALPGSVEGYYQEVGRAGRDGLPSRAVLMHSYVDRRMHAFFREKNYPEPDVLKKILKRVPKTGISTEDLRASCRIDAETFNAALEKLWIHGGVAVDAAETITPKGDPWEKRYAAQLQHRVAQEEAMARFTQSHACRMLHLVQYFGDTSDQGQPCGMCDVCAPDDCVVQAFSDATGVEQRIMKGILSRVGTGYGTGTGTVFKDVGQPAGVDRDTFEGLVAALVRHGLLEAEDAVFTKDGKDIPYQRLTITRSGERAGISELEQVKVPRAHAVEGGRGKKARRKAKGPPATGVDQALLARLKRWRTAQSKKLRVPPFRVAADKVLEEIARARPSSMPDLHGIKGVGPAFLKTHAPSMLIALSEAEQRGVRL